MPLRPACPGGGEGSRGTAAGGHLHSPASHDPKFVHSSSARCSFAHALLAKQLCTGYLLPEEPHGLRDPVRYLSSPAGPGRFTTRADSQGPLHHGGRQSRPPPRPGGGREHQRPDRRCAAPISLQNGCGARAASKRGPESDRPPRSLSVRCVTSRACTAGSAGMWGRAQQAGCGCGQKAEHRPGQNKDNPRAANSSRFNTRPTKSTSARPTSHAMGKCTSAGCNRPTRSERPDGLLSTSPGPTV